MQGLFIRLGSELRSKQKIAKVFARQANIKGDKTKAKDFKDDALSNLNLKFFAYMKPGNPMIQVMHSAFRCPNEDMPRDVRGRDIGFCGERTDIVQPVAADIPKQKAWEFYTDKAVINGVGIVSHYGEDGVKMNMN